MKFNSCKAREQARNVRLARHKGTQGTRASKALGHASTRVRKAQGYARHVRHEST